MQRRQEKAYNITAFGAAMHTVLTVLPQIMARAFISFQQLFTPATKQDQRLIYETGVHHLKF